MLLFYFIVKTVQSYIFDQSIKMFNVGQGDSLLITTYAGNRILIDGGNNYEISRYLNYFFLFGNCKLDLVILTHAHADHYKGLERLFEYCIVGQVIDPSNKLKISTTKFFIPVPFKEYKIDGLSFWFVWPYSKQPIFSNLNNNSVVFLLKYRTFEALFTGDIEREGLEKLDYLFLKNKIHGALDVLKVPHHGGASSLHANLGLLNPAVCLISVGNNRYSHPHRNTLELYKQIGCNTKRTDQVGTIEVLIE